MLQTLMMMILFAANLVHAAWTDYEEKRDLELETEGLESLQIEAGAGGLEVEGVAGASRIVVAALIRVPDADADEAREIIREDLVLRLERKGNRGDLKAYFESDGRLLGNSPSVSLDIRVPEHLSLDIEDGSGAVDIRKVRGDIRLADGSGAIRMEDVGGRLDVRDGSGSITIEGAGGDVAIVDGSGSVSVAGAAGNVRIEDGSGGIEVSEVAGDLIIPRDGSGSVDFLAIAGRVDVAD